MPSVSANQHSVILPVCDKPNNRLILLWGLHRSLTHHLYCRLINWLVGCSIDWLINWLIGWLINWLIDWLIKSWIDWLIDWPIVASVTRFTYKLLLLVPGSQVKWSQNNPFFSVADIVLSRHNISNMLKIVSVYSYNNIRRSYLQRVKKLLWFV